MGVVGSLLETVLGVFSAIQLRLRDLLDLGRGAKRP